MPVELVVGVLTDAARVEHDDVGRLEIVGRLHAVGDEQARDPLGVVLVHLAPVGAHEEAAGHGGQCTSRPSTRPARIGPRPDLARGSGPVQPGPRTVRPRPSTGSAVDFGFLGLVDGQVDLGLLRSTSSTSSTPLASFTFSLISTIMSTFSERNVFTFSRPWPSCSPS